LARRQIPMLEHTYLPDLAPCEFFMFLKLETSLKVSLFWIIERDI
jgi:hypothetical protein